MGERSSDKDSKMLKDWMETDDTGESNPIVNNQGLQRLTKHELLIRAD